MNNLGGRGVVFTCKTHQKRLQGKDEIDLHMRTFHRPGINPIKSGPPNNLRTDSNVHTDNEIRKTDNYDRELREQRELEKRRNELRSELRSESNHDRIRTPFRLPSQHLLSDRAEDKYNENRGPFLFPSQHLQFKVETNRYSPQPQFNDTNIDEDDLREPYVPTPLPRNDYYTKNNTNKMYRLEDRNLKTEIDKLKKELDLIDPPKQVPKIEIVDVSNNRKREFSSRKDVNNDSSRVPKKEQTLKEEIEERKTQSPVIEQNNHDQKKQKTLGEQMYDEDVFFTEENGFDHNKEEKLSGGAFLPFDVWKKRSDEVKRQEQIQRKAELERQAEIERQAEEQRQAESELLPLPLELTEDGKNPLTGKRPYTKRLNADEAWKMRSQVIQQRLKEGTLPDNLPDMGFLCSRCDYVANKIYELRNHERAVHDKIKDKICKSCPYKTSYKSVLRQHVAFYHENKRDHNCDRCGYEAMSKYRLRMHVKISHDRVKDVICDLCPASYCDRGSLRAHVNSIHLGMKGKQKPKHHKCPKCGYETASPTVLRTHIKAVHDKIKDTICQYCPYATAHEKRMKKHIRFYHEKVYDHVCEFCSYRAITGQSLKLHIKSVHEKVKDEQCHLCPATFSRKDNLREHVKSFHEKVRRFNCEQCPYETNRKQNMVVHVNSTHELPADNHQNSYIGFTYNWKEGGPVTSTNGNVEPLQYDTAAGISQDPSLSHKLSLAQSEDGAYVKYEEGTINPHMPNSNFANENVQPSNLEAEPYDASRNIQINPHMPNSQFQYADRSFGHSREMKINPHMPNNNYFYK